MLKSDSYTCACVQACGRVCTCVGTCVHPLRGSPSPDYTHPVIWQLLRWADVRSEWGHGSVRSAGTDPLLRGVRTKCRAEREGAEARTARRCSEPLGTCRPRELFRGHEHVGPVFLALISGQHARGSGALSVDCPPRPRCLLKVSLPSCFQPSPEASGLGVASYATSLSRERPARGPSPDSACFLFPSVTPVSRMGTTGAGAQDGCRRKEKNSTVYDTV